MGSPFDRLRVSGRGNREGKDGFPPSREWEKGREIPSGHAAIWNTLTSILSQDGDLCITIISIPSCLLSRPGDL